MTTLSKALLGATAGLLLGSTAIVHAQSGGGMSAGPGSSAAAPGAEMQSGGSMGGPEASDFAPGGQSARDDTLGRADRDDQVRRDGDDRTTGFGRDSDDRLRNDRDDQMMDTDTRGIGKD
jgi:hypothetical protein